MALFNKKLKLLKNLAAFLLLIAALSSHSFGQDISSIEEKGIIVDGAKLLSTENLKESSRLIKEIKKNYDLNIYLITSDTSYGLSTEEYKNRIIDSWGLKDESIILISIVIEDNVVFAHISNNLETKLSKNNLEMIISQTMIKSFQKGNFESGILNTLTVLEQYFGGTPLNQISQLKESKNNLIKKAVIIILIITAAFFLFKSVRRKQS